MTDIGKWWWTCLRKKAYSTERFAARVARQVNAKRALALVPYGCGHCGQYHIGRKGVGE